MDKDTITATKKWFESMDDWYGSKWVITPACPPECPEECEGHGFSNSPCPICDGLAGDRYGIATFKTDSYIDAAKSTVVCRGLWYDDVCSDCYALAAGVAEQDGLIEHCGYNPKVVSEVFKVWGEE